ncbi:hypothetical protein POM88_019040 [Heracleum sosnowskyi]|uniref:Uncharacterized protein n=1 Tax=Heracleum sosnowskyi TaxID=360622 RepID=A0AAD8IRM1_9APIA|nr:hypothetical protein POM88_019040 [Heracleum sosnowskyi]
MSVYTQSVRLNDVSNRKVPKLHSMSLSTSLRELHNHILNSMRLHLYGITSMHVLSRFNLPFQGALKTIQGRLTDGAWTIADSSLDLHDPRLLAMTAAEHHLLEAGYDDSDANGAAFFRSVTLIPKALLLLRHVLAMGDIDSDDVPYVDLPRESKSAGGSRMTLVEVQGIVEFIQAAKRVEISWW